MHPVIETSKLDKSLLPTSEIACASCPLATWYSTPNEMSAHCGRMFMTVWNSNKQGAITECGAQQEALQEKEREEQQTVVYHHQEPQAQLPSTMTTSFGLAVQEVSQPVVADQSPFL